MRNRIQKLAALSLAAGWLSGAVAAAADETILNVSYDVTREFYKDFNAAFAAYWKDTTSNTVAISQSHGGSSKQAQAVVNGLEADVVTMNQPTDVDCFFQRAADSAELGGAAAEPQRALHLDDCIRRPQGQSEAHSKIGMILIRPEFPWSFPNPKTSGNGRYSYLAAWGYALKKSGGDEKSAREFVGKLFANVPVLDTGGRGATITFADNGIGDVLLTFESEAAQVRKNFADDALEVVVPPASILAENPVAWVDRNVERHHTEAVARAYLEFLYSDAGQELAAKYYFRPKSRAALDKFPDRFKPLDLFTVNEIAGGWQQAQQKHFADGGIFDQIYQHLKQNKQTKLWHASTMTSPKPSATPRSCG